MTIYDLHTHSTFSDGQAEVEYIIKRAAELGYRAGISDHLFCEGLYTAGDIERYLNYVCRLGIPVGGEANIGEDFPMPDRLLSRFDYIIASVHTVFPGDGPVAFGQYFAMRAGFRESWAGYDKARAQEFLELAYRHTASHLERYRADILGHCCVMPFYHDMPYESPELLDWEKAVVSLCRRHRVAMEISGMWREPYERLLRLAKSEGVLFSFGSDCHTVQGVCDLRYSLEMAYKLGLEEQDLFIPVYRP